ncbi:MAG: CehA/McbA family metallohydrolase [Planctomycetia bacterium]
MTRSRVVPSPRAVRLRAVAVMLAWLAVGPVSAAEVPVFTDVERQPFVAAARRLVEALDRAGAPLAAAARGRIEAAAAEPDDARAVLAIQDVLDPLCLAVVTINPESRVKVAEGPAPKELMQQGWRTFLVKVRNEAGVNPPLRVASPNALRMTERGREPRERPRTTDALVGPADIPDRFLELALPAGEPLKPALSGLEVEYRPLEVFCRDAGPREATLQFDIGAGTQDVGFRSEIPVLFKAVPAVKVTLRVADVDGQPTIAAFTIRDGHGRVYPLPSRRLAPDFFFHDQVYRADGEHVLLPPGDYEVAVTRGPEYRRQTLSVRVPEAAAHEVGVKLERWIHAAARGWHSGDHHVHAAGCSHYDSPTEGVGPEAMMRHVRGEDLAVGCVLSWGPCWYTQKQFFDGRVSALSARDSLLRYDVEVSGFPSSHGGHLCLLRLTEDDYPGTTKLEEWPSWTLPVLRWAKGQGAVVGYSHSGWGLAPPDILPDGSREYPPDSSYGVSSRWRLEQRGWQGRAGTAIPDHAMPRFDGIGANEYIVTAPLGACDFISVGDTPPVWELSIWYHALNCGLTTRISGETDFPCIYDERVGLGRAYVGLGTAELTYDAWIEGLRDGRSYCGDGRSHILDFAVGDRGVGVRDAAGVASRLDLDAAGEVMVTFAAAALLAERPTAETEAIRGARPDQKPFWHVERARIAATRQVPVEVIVNGRVAATRELVADGHVEEFRVPVKIDRSSWVAVRIMPSAHTNPVFVQVGGAPVRASKRSGAWCERAVDVCWTAKPERIRPAEREAARAAYDEARAFYARVRAEAPAD